MERVYPKLVENGFHIIPAKWKESEQSKLAHILNGIFPIIRLFKFLEGEGQRFPEEFRRKVICAIVIHDVLKGIKENHTDAMLKDANEWSKRLSLKEFCPTLDERDLRAVVAAHMKWSKRKGAILTSDLDPRILVFVNLADYLSSMKTPEEFLTAQKVLEEINSRLRFTYHKVSETRGYVTGFIHMTISKILKDRYNAIPLLFFPNGILYIGKREEIKKMREDLKGDSSFSTAILKTFRDKVTVEIPKEILDDWINPTRNRNFIVPISFLFFSLKEILDATRKERIEYRKRMEERGWPTTPKERSDRIQKVTNGEISIELTDEDELLAPYFRILTFILSEVVGVKTSEAVFILAKTLGIQLPENEMRKYAKWLRTGAGYDDCRILAKHYLDHVDLNRTRNFIEIIDELNERCKEFIKPYESEESIRHLLSALGLEFMWDEINGYIHENVLIDGKGLILPVDQESRLFDLKEVAREACSICTRTTKGAKQFIDFTKLSSKIFTNWRPPWKAKEERRICGVCYIEFALRNVFLPIAELRNKDERCYLLIFLFPQYSFTSDLWDILNEKMQYMFEEPSTRFDSYKAASHILTESIFNPMKYKEFGTVLTIGDFSMVLKPIFYTPGFFFLVWSVPKPPERTTETEKWFLATYFALLLQQTLDVKVLVTQSVYPHISHSGDISGVIRLVSPHHFIRNIFKEDITLQQIEKFTNLAAAIWCSHRNIWNKLPEDDRVAHILKTMTSVIFPGSTLLMRYLRLSNKNLLTVSERDNLMKKACIIIDKWRE
jgi:hypothetical protein